MFKIKFRSDFLQIGIDWVVSNVENVLIRATPLLAPIPSAFAINYALERANWPGAGWLGGIIEALGLCAGATMGGIAMFNSRHPRRAIHPWIGYGLFGFYVLVAVLIVGGYETLPTLSHWWNQETATGELIKSIVPLLFPGLTLIGSVIVALREYMRRADDEAQHEQERTEASQDAAQRRQDAEFELSLEIKRQEAAQRLALQQAEHEQKLELQRRKVETKLSTSVNRTGNETGNKTLSTLDRTPVDDQELTAKLLEVYSVNPRASLRKAGSIVGLSHTGVSKMLDRLESAGAIHRNGNGVEVH